MRPFTWLKQFWTKEKLPKKQNKPSDQDSIKLILPGLYMSMHRPVEANKVPHEVSMYVPRAEFRKFFEEEGKRTTLEVILNSITIVHAPRHEPLGDPPSEADTDKK